MIFVFFIFQSSAFCRTVSFGQSPRIVMLTGVITDADVVNKELTKVVIDVQIGEHGSSGFVHFEPELLEAFLMAVRLEKLSMLKGKEIRVEHDPDGKVEGIYVQGQRFDLLKARARLKSDHDSYCELAVLRYQAEQRESWMPWVRTAASVVGFGLGMLVGTVLFGPALFLTIPIGLCVGVVFLAGTHIL